MYRQSEKNLLNSNISSRCPHNVVNFGPLTAEIVGEFGAPQQIWTGFASLLRWCTDIAHRSQPNLAQCLTISWAGTLYIHLRGLFPSDGILPGAKFTLCPSLAFSYIGSVTALHSSTGCQPKFAACYKEWNYATFAEDATYIRQGGHHIGHRPTF